MIKAASEEFNLQQFYINYSFISNCIKIIFLYDFFEFFIIAYYLLFIFFCLEKNIDLFYYIKLEFYI